MIKQTLNLKRVAVRAKEVNIIENLLQTLIARKARKIMKKMRKMMALNKIKRSSLLGKMMINYNNLKNKALLNNTLVLIKFQT